MCFLKKYLRGSLGELEASVTGNGWHMLVQSSSFVFNLLQNEAHQIFFSLFFLNLQSFIY